MPGFRGDGFQRYSNAAFSRPRKFRTFSRLPALAVPGAGVTRLKATVTKATVTRGARAVLRRQQNGIAKRKNARPAPPRATVPAHFRAREQSNSSRRYRMIIFSETHPRKPACRRHSHKMACAAKSAKPACRRQNLKVFRRAKSKNEVFRRAEPA